MGLKAAAMPLPEKEQGQRLVGDVASDETANVAGRLNPTVGSAADNARSLFV